MMISKVASVEQNGNGHELNGSSAESSVQAQRWLRMPAHKLSALIKSGKISCTQLCRLYIERIKLVQPSINGMAQDRFETALREAQDLDNLLARYKEEKEEEEEEEDDDEKASRDQQENCKTTGRLSQEQLDLLASPLFGVPLTVKESIRIKGMRNTAGSWLYRDQVAEEDAVVIKNVKRHGMIPICTTNIPELTLYWADCNNLVYGRSRNPYDRTRVTGASSGGEAALLASGASVCGLGSDIGGSLRIPAHYCGVMSHKPSPFLVSSEGNFPSLKESRLRIFTLGPMCRYASDLRYMLMLLMSDKENATQDTYKLFQPSDIGKQRQNVLRQLANVREFSDLSRVKFLYCNFKQTNRLAALVGSRETRVQREIMSAQSEVLEHFASKFGCKLELVDLDKYMDKMYVTWHAMIVCAGTIDRDKAFEPHDVAHMYGINNLFPEMVKYCFGMSKHTKESILSILVGLPIPNNRERAYKIGEKLEKFASEMKCELEQAMGEFGCIVMPTLPTTALKHHLALLKRMELRFPSLWNVCQMPATHVTIRTDKKRGLPYGLSVASRPFNDALTISIAEEIERTFGGWTPPPLADLSTKYDKI